MMMSSDTNRQANLRALQRMLAYARVESRREGLSEVVELLAAAQLALAKTVSAGSSDATSRDEPSEPARIRLVAFGNGRYKEGGEPKI
jgi:hypothetical protein